MDDLCVSVCCTLAIVSRSKWIDRLSQLSSKKFTRYAEWRFNIRVSVKPYRISCRTLPHDYLSPNMNVNWARKRTRVSANRLNPVSHLENSFEVGFRIPMFVHFLVKQLPKMRSGDYWPMRTKTDGLVNENETCYVETSCYFLLFIGFAVYRCEKDRCSYYSP